MIILDTIMDDRQSLIEKTVLWMLENERLDVQKKRARDGRVIRVLFNLVLQGR